MPTYVIQANVYGTAVPGAGVHIMFPFADVAKPSPTWFNLGNGSLQIIMPVDEDGSFKCSPLVFKNKTVQDPSWKFDIMSRDEEENLEIIGYASVTYNTITE